MSYWLHDSFVPNVQTAKMSIFFPQVPATILQTGVVPYAVAVSCHSLAVYVTFGHTTCTGMFHL